MPELLDLFCPECDAEVRAQLQDQPAVLSVRGEPIRYSETVAICPTCGETIGDARIEAANLERAYGAYRALHGILAPGEVRALRVSYGLSLREFSRFLGFGEQTAYRYEHGDLPDQPHNTTMLSARTVEGARLLLTQNRPRLNGKSIARIEQRIRAMTDDAAFAGQLQPRFVLEYREDDVPSAANGFRRLDLARVAAVVYELAAQCRDLYWTKLQKALFFADMVCYERCSRSLTGLSYVRATYGPVVDRREELRFLLGERGTVGFRELGWGEVLVPLRLGSQPFDEDELALVGEVAHFADSFATARELSDFSQGLRSWRDGIDGGIIEYTRDDGEVGRALLERMSGRRSS